MVVIIHQPILTILMKMKDFFTRGGYSARDPTTDGGEDATNSDTTTGIEPFDLCDNAQDLSMWYGGLSNDYVHNTPVLLGRCSLPSLMRLVLIIIMHCID
jgi:hypothetical protein